MSASELLVALEHAREERDAAEAELARAHAAYIAAIRAAREVHTVPQIARSGGITEAGVYYHLRGAA